MLHAPPPYTPPPAPSASTSALPPMPARAHAFSDSDSAEDDDDEGTATEREGARELLVRRARAPATEPVCPPRPIGGGSMLRKT
jgi:hypothetical protein